MGQVADKIASVITQLNNYDLSRNEEFHALRGPGKVKVVFYFS